MGNKELGSKYELVVIVDAKQSPEVKETVRKEITDAVARQGGKVINSQVWLEKHKMTFRIKKCAEGTYYLFNVEGAPDMVEKVRPLLKINENILRFDFIRLQSKASVAA